MHTGIDAVPRMAWPQRWAILFGYPPSEQERDALQDWLDEQFSRGWDAADLHDALELYAERERKDGRRARAPTGPQVKSAMIRLMHERRQSRDGGSSGSIRWRNPDTRRIEIQTLGWARDALAHADPEERWEIICGVLEKEDGDPIKRELMSYAEGLPDGVERNDVFSVGSEGLT